MPEFINNVSTLDKYDPSVTLGPAPGVSQISFSVLNEPALAQFYKYTDDTKTKAILEPFERLFVQGTFGAIYTDIAGVQFRSAVAGSSAQIIGELSYKFDPKGSGGTLSSVIVSSTGQTTSQLLVPTVTLANFPPANPVDSQAVYVILPSTFDPIGGKPVRWLATFDAASGVWHVTGSPLFAEVLTQETDVANTYGDLATVGPSILLPRPGDYLIAVGNDLQNNAGNIGFMAYSGGGISASDSDSAATENVTLTSAVAAMREREKIALNISTSITAKYRFGNNTTFRAKRWMKITPIRIT